MKALFYFLVTTTETGMTFTFISGGLRVSKRPDCVRLTNPSSTPVLEVLSEPVHPTNEDELARRIPAERYAWKAGLN